MSQANPEKRDLKTFEAQLASLRPRAAMSEVDFRTVLAKEAAALTANRGVAIERCTSAAGHRFACIHCGCEASPSVVRRWAWPVAFSGMTAVAALFLMLLIERPRPQLAAVTPKPSTVVKPKQDRQMSDPTKEVIADSRFSYYAFRNQILREGMDAWRSPVASVSSTSKVKKADRVMNRREQMEEFLNESTFRGT